MENIGNSKEFKNAVARAKALATNNEPCLIVGARGVGKRHLANFIHKQSPHEAENFTIFDASEHEEIAKALFGFVRTNILGIENINIGAIESTGSGTLFIDNVQFIPLDIQMQLSATIQLGGYKPVGSEETLRSLCRFIFAIPSSHEKFVAEKKLLPELVHLFSRNTLVLPSLRERSEDIEPLASYFIKKWSENLNLTERSLSKAAVKLLKRYTWPGNVAELQTLILGAMMNFTAKEIDAGHLQLKIDGNWHVHTAEQLEELALEELVEKKLSQFMARLGKYDIENLHAAILERVERPLIKLVMERSRNNQLKAAKILGINRNTLRTKLQKLEIL